MNPLLRDSHGKETSLTWTPNSKLEFGWKAGLTLMLKLAMKSVFPATLITWCKQSGGEAVYQFSGTKIFKYFSRSVKTGGMFTR